MKSVKKPIKETKHIYKKAHQSGVTRVMPKGKKKEGKLLKNRVQTAETTWPKHSAKTLKKQQ